MAVDKTIKGKTPVEKKELTKMVFGRMNYIIMLSGIGLLILGFFVMTLDKEQYGFGFVGLTLGPLIVAVGFATEFFAIFYKSKPVVIN